MAETPFPHSKPFLTTPGIGGGSWAGLNQGAVSEIGIQRKTQSESSF